MTPDLSLDFETSAQQHYSAHNPIEQYVLLSKSAKGAACLELIKQVLEAPGVYVFGELLEMPNIAEVRTIRNTKRGLNNGVILFSVENWS